MRQVALRSGRPSGRWSMALAVLIASSLMVVLGTVPASASTVLPTFAPAVTFSGVVNAGGSNGLTVKGDLNGDGLDDLITGATIFNGTSIVDVVVTQLSIGNGQFAPPVQATIRPELAGNAIDTISTGDLNHDGHLDVVFGFLMRFFSLSTSTIVAMLGVGDGTFGAPISLTQGGTPASVYSSAVADVTGDGNNDIVSQAGTTAFQVSVLPGLGDGTFGAPILSPSGAISPLIAQTLVADVTGDGIPDAVLLEQTGNSDVSGMNVLVEKGVGHGTFNLIQRLFLDTNPVHAALADMNGDGQPDLVITGSGGTDGGRGGLFLLSGGSGGIFVPAIRFPRGGAGLAVADFNGDLLLDIATSEVGAGGQFLADVYVNAPGGMSAGSLMVTVSVPGPIVLSGRLNNDAFPDLVGSAPYVVMNTTGTVPPTAGPIISGIALNPASVTGGGSSVATVTLSGAATTGGAIVMVTTSDPIGTTVPASVTVPAGATTATFTINTAPVFSSRQAVISASFGGASVSAQLTVNPPDVVTIQIASYQHSTKLLTVQATSNRAGAVLTVYVTSTGQLIGTLQPAASGTYAGQFAMPTDPRSITVKSSLGGSGTATVTTK